MYYPNKFKSLKFMKRSQIYQGSNYNVTFDPKTKKATSYNWWVFVAEIEGKIIFNNYRYSVTTSKHQQKVKDLLHELGIKIDIEMPLSRGIQMNVPLSEQILLSEEELSDRFLVEQIKKQERYQRQKAKKFAKKLENYLESSVHFRDYKILPTKRFGQINEVAVHQVVENIEQDVQNALYNFNRDGFSQIYFYVEGI
jgi:hypothetical protein